MQVVDVRTAEALKYACNAFHATKVSFANEMGRIFRHYGVDSREVMEIFCQDTSLNISPYYLRPASPSAARACRRTCARCCTWPG